MTTPRHHTPRDPTLRTIGAHYQHTMRAGYGVVPKPHQTGILDVAGELVEDPRTTTGFRWRYSTIVISTPRQVGKTTMIDAAMSTWANLLPGTVTVYTAQSGKDARKRFVSNTQKLRQGPLDQHVQQYYFAAGSERIVWATGSRTAIFAPTLDAIHGDTIDFALFDEAYAHRLERGKALEQAVMPAMNTRQLQGFGTQIWIVSTQGDATSTWLEHHYQRAIAAQQGHASIALFDYGATPEAAWDNEQVWFDTHPGLAHGLTTVEYLREQAESLGEQGFRRAYLNQPESVAAAVSPTIPPHVWAAGRTHQLTHSKRPTIAADVAWDRSHAAIVAASITPTGETHIELIDYRAGVDWVPGRCADLQRKHGSLIHVDGNGPATHLRTLLQQTRVKHKDIGWSGVSAGTAILWDTLHAGTLKHLTQPALDTAAANATRRDVGDRWAFDRRKSPKDISPLTAAVIAVSAAQPHSAARTTSA